MSIEDVADDVTTGTAFKFADIGDKIVGRILDAEKRQQTEYQSGEPEFYKDGSPKYQYVFTLDVDGEDDLRRIFARGHMWYAIKQAIGQQGLEVGGTLAVEHIGTEELGGGMNAKKLFRAQYKPPAEATGIAGEDLI